MNVRILYHTFDVVFFVGIFGVLFNGVLINSVVSYQSEIYKKNPRFFLPFHYFL
jgi:hypothetical protein